MQALLQTAKKPSLRGQKIAGRANTGGKRTKPISATKAKMLKPEQFAKLQEWVRSGRHPERDTALVLLSFGCGLRAQEIAGLNWKRNILDSDGKIDKVLRVTADIGKRTQARDIPMRPELRAALQRLRLRRPDDLFVIYSLFESYSGSERQNDMKRGQTHPNTLVHYLRRLYLDCGFTGTTSHSGRRTFITNLARRCNEAGASLLDVQHLAGHKDMNTTAGYIEPSDRQNALVRLAY